MLRTSSYTIYVDLPALTDEVLLIHGYSGAYDRVSGSVARYLRSREDGRAGGDVGLSEPLSSAPAPLRGGATSPPCDETIAVLKKRGYLTEKTVEQERVVVEKRVSDLVRSARMPGYVVVPTYDCNLRCRYCFENGLRAQLGREGASRIMDREMVDRVVGAFTKLESKHGIQEGGARTRRFSLYGGEPLMERTRGTVAYFMEKARSSGSVKAVFSSVSNCFELHHFQDLLGPELIGRIQVTFDGSAKEHDRRRVGRNGSATFGRIGDNVGLALEKGVSIVARVNVDANNMSTLPELAEEFAVRGWDKNDRFESYVTPIHGDASCKNRVDSWALYRKLHSMYERYPLLTMIKPSPAGEAADVLKGSTNDSMFRSSFCSAHTNMYVFDACGKVFACWERMGSDEQALAHLSADGELVFNSEIERRWHSRTVLSCFTCRECRFALLCGGGCVSLAEQTHGSFSANYCDGFPERFMANAARAFAEYRRERKAQRQGNNGCSV